MFDYNNNQYMINSLTRQKEKIDDMLKTYQNMPQQTPVNNFINTTNNQTPYKDLIEWRILNENEEVDNLYVANKTLFINENNMVLKGVDGSLEKWEIKKTYPIDKKDQKINELENEIKNLKEIINNEYGKSNESIKQCKQSVSVDDIVIDREPKTNGKSISKEK